MSWIDGLKARLRLLTGRGTAESRFDSEIRFHVDMEAQRLEREEGLTPGEARRRALVAFGGVEQHREALRDGRGTAWLAGLSLDFKLGIRMLVKHPGLTLVGVLGLSVAVAIGTFAFTAVNAVTGSSLPLDEGHRIVAIRNFDPRSDDEVRRTHLHDMESWREAKTLTLMSASRIVPSNLVATGVAPTSARVAQVTASAFRVARVNPLRGRFLRDDDEAVGAPAVAVIGHDLWQAWLGGRPDVLEARIELNGVPHDVVGVMPQGFAFPVNNQVWTPLRLNALDYLRGKAPSVDVFARLAPGASLTAARAELATIGRRLALAYPETNEHLLARVNKFSEPFLDAPGGALVLHVVQVIVSLLLVVIGTNVAILVYARTAGRAGEMAVRTALGASRRRIVAQLFAEALVLSGVASVLGLLTARQALAQAEAMVQNAADGQLPYWMHAEITPVTVVYTVGLAALAAVIIGIIPGLRATRGYIVAGLKLNAGGGSIRLGKSWSALLITQVAVSVAALPVALAGGQRWVQVGTHEFGTPVTESFVLATPLLSTSDPEAPDSASVAARNARYATGLAALGRQLGAASGAFDVARMSWAPGDEGMMRLEFEASAGATAPDPAAPPAGRQAAFAEVDSAYFTALGVRVLAGRNFGAADFTPAARPVIVNRSFVRDALKGASALGRRVREPAERDGAAPGPWREIVGVVDDFPALVAIDALAPKLYLPLLDQRYPVTFAVRGRGMSAARTADEVRRAAIAVDPDLRFTTIRTLRATLEESARAERLALLALVSVALSVVLIAAAGIYALMSFTVARRQREIGIRAALGARKSQVLREVLSRALRQVGLGIVIGVAGAGVLARAVGDSSTVTDYLLMLARVAGLMLAVGIAASIGPARRALRVEPTEALRAE